jgi:hypothetical protein
MKLIDLCRNEVTGRRQNILCKDDYPIHILSAPLGQENIREALRGFSGGHRPDALYQGTTSQAAEKACCWVGPGFSPDNQPAKFVGL